MLIELSVVEQRYEAVREVLDTAATITDVAARHGVDRRTLHRWISRYANVGDARRRATARSSRERTSHPAFGRRSGFGRCGPDVREAMPHVEADRGVVRLADVEEQHRRLLAVRPSSDVLHECVTSAVTARTGRHPHGDELGDATARLGRAHHANGLPVELGEHVVGDVMQPPAPSRLGVERTRPVRQRRAERVGVLGERAQPQLTPVLPVVVDQLSERDHDTRG
jgi:transposase-like protein